MALLDTVKAAVARDYTNTFDTQLTQLMNAALEDLRSAGVTDATASTESPKVIQAVCTYVKANFGETDEYTNLKDAYDEQKASLSMDANHTNYAAYGVKSWLEVHTV
jgi:hypothetical protein